MTVNDAKNILSEAGFNLKLNIEDEKNIDKKNTIITNQFPKHGIKLEKGSNIMCDIY